MPAAKALTFSVTQTNMEKQLATTESSLEVIPPTALESIQRGEIDVQIRTAHQYPRSMATFKRRAIDMATIDQETAESCIYVRPVGMKNGQMQYAEGLSVRMAEIVGASYGNLRVGSMIVEQTERYVITRGFAHDLESNFASTSEVKQATVTKKGEPFSEDMRAVVAKAALAKARRDATFQVVPKALCRPVETAARALIAGDAKSLTDRTAAAMSFLQRLNIDLARVWAALGIRGEADLTSELLMTLTGIRNSIRDKETVIDEAFPVIIAQAKIGAVNPLDEVKPAAKETKTLAKEPAKPTEGFALEGSAETDMEKLKRLMRESDVKEADLVKHAGGAAKTLGELPEKTVTEYLTNWDKYKNEIERSF